MDKRLHIHPRKKVGLKHQDVPEIVMRKHKDKDFKHQGKKKIHGSHVMIERH